MRAHLWKRQLEEGKHANIKKLSAKINIGTRRIQQILRLNYLAPKIKEDIVKGRQLRGLKLSDLREIPVLWSEQLEKFYGLASYFIKATGDRCAGKLKGTTIAKEAAMEKSS